MFIVTGMLVGGKRIVEEARMEWCERSTTAVGARWRAYTTSRGMGTLCGGIGQRG